MHSIIRRYKSIKRKCYENNSRTKCSIVFDNGKLAQAFK